MRIRKYIYQCGTAISLLALTACSANQLEEADLTPGNTPIQLMGVNTRAAGDGYSSLDAYKNSGLELSSRINRNTSGSGDADYVNYFTNISLNITTSTTTNQSKLEAPNAYYPLSDIPLRLFGHTGKIDSNNKLTLTSGEATTDKPLMCDFLVSNGTDGLGTEGRSGIKENQTDNNTYVTLMEFRHVMTKLEVDVKVTDDAMEDTKPTDIAFRFKDGFVSKSGKYLITNAVGTDNDKATDLSTESGANNFGFKVGTYYLVPNGKTLSGKGTDGNGLLSYLKIDDYTATAEDLNAIEIGQADLNGTKSDLTLKPGLAYKLTFEIKRLKVVGIKLTVENWNIANSTPDWSHDPYKMTLSVTGGYDASTENNKFTQVVLHHKVTVDSKEVDYQYVGKGSYATNDDKKTDIDFLSIPKSLDDKSVLTVDAYTKNGLLIEGQPVTYTAGTNKGDISLSLSQNGMADDGKGTYLVSTPLQFYHLLINPIADKAYRIIKNIDMDALSELNLDTQTPKDFPAGSTLEGGTYPDANDAGIVRTSSILHLKRKGGLFATNKGTLKNLYIFSGTITKGDSYTGSICNINEGTIEACVNEADITADGTTGGICGKNSGTILACLNTGNIQNGTTVGGICGENTKINAEGVIKACINTGMLNKTATNLGGICGTTTATSNQIINTCYWLTGTARKDQDTNNELAVGSDATNATSTNASDLAPQRLRSTEIINLLNAAASTWKFKLEPKICAWPIPVTSN